MDYDTIYNLFMIYVLAAMIIVIGTNLISDKIAKHKIRKALKSLEKEEGKLWVDFKRGQIDTVYVSSANRHSLENAITQILSKYDIDKNTLSITYEDYENHSTAYITYKTKETK